MDHARQAAFRVSSAYHEAGHAVIAALHGLLGERVVLGGSGEDAGETKLKPASDLGELRRYLQGYIIAAVAGREAQTNAIRRGLVAPLTSDIERERALVACVEANFTDMHDRELVASYLTRLGEPSDKAAVNALYDAAAPRAQLILGKPEVWAAVEAVAAVLLDCGEATREQVMALVPASAIEKATE